MSIKDKTKEKYRQLINSGWEARCYMASLLSMLLLIAFHKHNAIANGLSLACALTSSIGFSIWIKPFILRIWNNFIGKTILIAMNVFVGIAANGFSREYITGVLHLPAQDFPLTLSFFTALYFIPAWVLIVLFGGMTLVFIATIIYLSILMLLELIKFIHERISELAKPFGYDLPKIKQIPLNNGIFTGRLIGAFMALALIGTGMSAYDKGLHECTAIARNVAYYFDYSVTSAFPGLPKNKKTIMHNNGVVSVATKHHDGHIDIQVTKINQKEINDLKPFIE